MSPVTFTLIIGALIIMLDTPQSAHIGLAAIGVYWLFALSRER